MTKSELIERLINRHEHLSVKDVELAIKTMLDHMTGLINLLVKANSHHSGITGHLQKIVSAEI